MTRIRWAATAAFVAMALSSCWYQPRGNAGRTNAVASSSITVANVSGLAERWSVSVSPDAWRVAAPVANGGQVYAAAGNVTNRPVVTAVDIATGEVAWSARSDEWTFYHEPIIHGGDVVVRVQPGWMRFDRATGDAVLEPRDPDILQSFRDLSVGPQGVAELGELTGPSFHAYGIRYGPFSPYFTTSPGSVASYAFVGESIAWSEGFTALGFLPDCPSCGPSWQTPLGGTVGDATALGDDAAVYVDGTGQVSVLEMATGAVRWVGDVGATTPVRATVTDELILVGTADGRLVVFDADGCGAPTCAALWEGTVGAPVRSVLAAGDVAYVTTDGTAATIEAFDLAGCPTSPCTPLISLATGGRVTGDPIIASGHVIVGLADGRLVAYGLDP